MIDNEAAPPCGWQCSQCTHFNQGCAGCRQTGGKPFWTSEDEIPICPVYKCCVEKEGLEHCGLCPQLPCETFLNLRDPSMTDAEFQKSLTDRLAALRKWAEANGTS